MGGLVFSRKKLLLLALLALCVFNIGGRAEAKTLQEIVESKVLRVGIPGDYEPFAFPDYAGDYVGHDIDVANAIGEALGVEVLFVKSGWPALTQDLLEDKFDMAMGGITRTNARQQAGALSDVAYYFGKSLIIRKSDKSKFTTLEEVNSPNVRIGVNPGGTNEKFAKSKLDKAKITVIQDNMSIPALVAKGEIDVMVSENVEVKKYVVKDARLAGVFVEKTLTRDTGGYFFKKEDRDLLDFVNLWLSNAKVNGTLDALHSKWLK